MIFDLILLDEVVFFGLIAKVEHLESTIDLS